MPKGNPLIEENNNIKYFIYTALSLLLALYGAYRLNVLEKINNFLEEPQEGIIATTKEESYKLDKVYSTKAIVLDKIFVPMTSSENRRSRSYTVETENGFKIVMPKYTNSNAIIEEQRYLVYKNTDGDIYQIKGMKHFYSAEIGDSIKVSFKYVKEFLEPKLVFTKVEKIENHE